jgi:hypothetical protein
MVDEPPQSGGQSTQDGKEPDAAQDEHQAGEPFRKYGHEIGRGFQPGEEAKRGWDEAGN